MAGSYIQYSEPIKTDFFQTIDRFSRNTIVFENHSTISKYVDKSKPRYNTTELNLCYFDDIIMTKYLLRLREKATTRAIDDESRKRYDLNPFLCAKELLDSVDYWWLILVVNDKLSIHEFTKLDSTIKLPNVDDLRLMLKYEMQKNNQFGTLEE